MQMRDRVETSDDVLPLVDFARIQIHEDNLQGPGSVGGNARANPDARFVR
jgi:hypothetical protein